MIISSNSGTVSRSKTLPQYATHVNLINDGPDELTITVSGQVVTVLGLEQFEGDFSPFISIIITASGPWRYVIEASEALIGDESATPNGQLIKNIRSRISDNDAIAFQTADILIDGYELQRMGHFSRRFGQIKSGVDI